MIQSGGFLCMLRSLGSITKELHKKVIRDIAITLARHNLPGLVTNLVLNAT